MTEVVSDAEERDCRELTELATDPDDAETPTCTTTVPELAVVIRLCPPPGCSDAHTRPSSCSMLRWGALVITADIISTKPLLVSLALRLLTDNTDTADTADTAVTETAPIWLVARAGEQAAATADCNPGSTKALSLAS